MANEHTVTVETADPDDRRRLVDTLTLAFGSDPLMRWSFPSADDYLRWFPEFVACYAGAAFEEGTAYHVRDGAGAALWLPPETEPDADDLVELLQTALPEDRRTDAWTAFERIERRSPDEPHWYLPLIGVEPMHQGNGLGTALVSDAVERLDRNGDVAYLESANPANLSLYLRFGFELLEPIRVGSVPPLFPMIREPTP